MVLTFLMNGDVSIMNATQGCQKGVREAHCMKSESEDHFFSIPGIMVDNVRVS